MRIRPPTQFRRFFYGKNMIRDYQIPTSDVYGLYRPEFDFDPQRIRPLDLTVNTRFGPERICFENFPNDISKRRRAMFDWIEEEGGSHESGHAYGVIAEAISLHLMNRIFPEFLSLPVPSEFEATYRGVRGSDIIMLRKEVKQSTQKEVFDPVLLLDVTTRCFSGLKGKKMPGVYPLLETPVVILPIGDLYRTENTRISSYFETVMRRAFRTGNFDPLAGITDSEGFMNLFLLNFSQSMDYARTFMEVDHRKSRVSRYPLARKKFNEMDFIIKRKLEAL